MQCPLKAIQFKNLPDERLFKPFVTLMRVVMPTNLHLPGYPKDPTGKSQYGHLFGPVRNQVQVQSLGLINNQARPSRSGSTWVQIQITMYPSVDIFPLGRIVRVGV